MQYFDELSTIFVSLFNLEIASEYDILVDGTGATTTGSFGVLRTKKFFFLYSKSPPYSIVFCLSSARFLRSVRSESFVYFGNSNLQASALYFKSKNEGVSMKLDSLPL